MDDKEVGLYRKYEVKRLNDTTDKHKDCMYFVLDLDHDKYASKALEAYIKACEDEYPELSEDLKRLIK